MNSIKVVILFAFIASANCLISDDIFNIVSNNKRCNQSKSALDSLEIESCRTSGDRGSEDMLCNGIKSAMKDICNENSSIALALVKDSSKFDDSSDTFCEKVISLKVLFKLSKNVSDALNNMKNKSCSRLCSLVDGKLNPLCPFLVSYIELKNPPAPKNETVPKIQPVIKPETSVQNTINQTKPAEKPLAEPKPSNVPTKIEELPAPDITISKTNEIEQSNPEVVPPNQLPNKADNPSENIENPDPRGEFISPLDNEKPEESPDNPEINDKQFENTNDDMKSSVDHVNEPENGQNKAQEPESVKITSAEREPFDEAESSHFFTYFVFISALCIFFYVAMYNKKKILALMIEGRRSSVKRRPNSAAYSKLDCTLEEAMASGPSTSSSNTLLY